MQKKDEKREGRKRKEEEKRISWCRRKNAWKRWKKRGLKRTDEVRHEVRSRISRNRGTLPLRRSLIINSYLGPLPFSPILYCRQTTPATGIVFASLDDYFVREVFRSSSSVSLQISFLCRLIKLVWHISNYRHLISTLNTRPSSPFSRMRWVSLLSLVVGNCTEVGLSFASFLWIVQAFSGIQLYSFSFKSFLRAYFVRLLFAEAPRNSNSFLV